MLNKISFCGMSHLGLVYASVYAKFSKQVICFDDNKKVIKNLTKKKIDISEPSLTEQINKNFNKFKFTCDINDIVGSSLIFLSLDVQTDSSGKSNYLRILKILNLIKKIRLGRPPIIILSQVYPGFCDTIIKKFKNQIYYQVETLVFGEAIKRAMFPDRIIIGSKNKKIENKSYKYLLNNFNTPIINMNFKTAEITKISINILLVSTAMSSNFLSIISEKIGYDWKLITDSLKLDKRIGKYAYLSPSLGLSGGNLERDLNTLENICKKNKINVSIINSWKKISDHRKEWIFKILLKLPEFKLTKNIALLGLAYKKNTNSIKNSNAIFTSQMLKKKVFLAFDPIVQKEQVKKFKNIRIMDLKKCLNKTKIVLLTVPSDYFINFFKKNKKILKNKIVIDPYNILSGMKKMNIKKKYILGEKNI